MLQSPARGDADCPPPALLRDLHEEEAARASAFGRVLAIVAGSAFVITWFLSGHPQLQVAMLLSCAAIVGAGLWTSWRVRQGRYSVTVFRVFFAVSVAGSVAIQAYLGVFSAAPIAVTLGLSFFASGDDDRYALGLSCLTIFGYLAVAVPVVVGGMTDPGLVSGEYLSPTARVFFVIMTPIVYAVTIWHARRGRQTTREAFGELQRALSFAEEARQRSEQAGRAKSEFLANMSHEIRTPLNAVLGLGEVLLQTRLDDDQRSKLGTMVRSGSSLLAVLNDILDLAKIESGRMQLRVTPFSLRGLAEEVLGLFESLAQSKGLSLRLQAEEGVPGVVEGDAVRLRQVLTNLIGNAVKFTERGHVTLALVPAGSAEGPGRVRFEVRDTGIGIDSADQGRLFEEFAQADGSASRRYGGTGLGLAICHRLVDLMGGEIGVESEPGVGSVFWVELALPTRGPSSVPVEVGALEVSAEAERGAKERSRLLVVEDNEVNRVVLGSMLDLLGYEVAFAVSGRDALETLEAHSFDAVLMDCQLPELDGYEATRALRRRSAEEPRLPIIGVSAHAFDEHRQRALASGMDDYLSKPVRLEQLAEVLERWLPGTGLQELSAETSN